MAEDNPESEERHLVSGDAQKSTCRGLITVEPIAFLFMTASVLSATTTQEFVNYAVAEYHGADPSILTKSLCSGETNTTSVADVQTEAAQLLTVFSLLNALPMLFAAVLMGSYSDSRGRKIALVVPVFGGLFRGFVTLSVCYWKLDLRTLHAGAVMEGLCGGQSVFTTALFAYIADVSSRKRRSWRMFVLSLMETIGISLGDVSIAYLVTYTGFTAPFVLIVAIYILCLIYTVCVIRETVRRDSTQAGFFSLTHFARTFRLLFNVGDELQRWVLRCATAIMFLLVIFQGIVGYSMTLYLTQSPLCFTWVLLGYHQAVTAICKVVLGMLALWVLYNPLGDVGLLILACSTGLLSKLWLAIPIYNIVYVYTECVINALLTLVDPLTRAIMSKAVGRGEQGAVQALGAVAIVVGGLVGSPLATFVYSLTADVYTGAVFIIAGAVLLVILVIAVCMLRAGLQLDLMVRGATSTADEQGN